MDGAGDELLAGAALARDEHGGQAVGGLPDGLEDLEHLAAPADEVVEAPLAAELPLERLVLVPEALALQRVREDELDLVHLERLGDVVVRAELHRLHRRLGGRERGDDHHDGLGRVLLRRPEHREAVHLPHPEVGDDQVEHLTREGLDRLRAALADRDVVALLLQHDREEVAHAALVVHHEDPGVRHRGRGG